MSVFFLTTSTSDLIIFFFTVPSPTEIYTLSLHDALPISAAAPSASGPGPPPGRSRPRLQRALPARARNRSEEHTSELQSQSNLVCRLLLEKKKQYATRAIAVRRTDRACLRDVSQAC